MIVISDTSPLNYLILIDYQDVLPTLFGQIIIPQAVLNELQHAKTPEKIKNWITAKPTWLEVLNVRVSRINKLENLDYGEREAIFLAEELGADAILIDEKDGRREAAKLGFITIGTLSVLDRAAETGLISFSEAIDRLRKTPFREPKQIVEALLKKHKQI
jgi:predicted nucleic acid-binding protein